VSGGEGQEVSARGDRDGARSWIFHRKEGGPCGLRNRVSFFDGSVGANGGQNCRTAANHKAKRSKGGGDEPGPKLFKCRKGQKILAATGKTKIFMHGCEGKPARSAAEGDRFLWESKGARKNPGSKRTKNGGEGDRGAELIERGS